MTEILFRLEMMLMIALRRHAALWALLATLSLPTAALRADTFSALASDNATVQPNGPRPPTFGKIFLNTEGINNGLNGKFASFAVAEVKSSNLADANGNMMPSIPTGVNAITITLTQNNPSFTHVGSVKFYLAEDTTTSIQPIDDAVLFDPTDPSGEGLGTQLMPVHLLGSGNFTGTYVPNTSGTVDTFTFPPDNTTQLDDMTKAYVLSVLANSGTFRVLVTPADPDVAATYTGCVMDDLTTPNPAGPMLTLDVSF